MPNRLSRGKFKRKIVNHQRETPSDEMYNNSETTFFAYKMPKRDGWLRLDINLHKNIPVEDIIHEIGIRITEDRNLIDREFKARILKLREKHKWTAPTIARKLNLPTHRVKDIIHRRQKGGER